MSFFNIFTIVPKKIICPFLLLMVLLLQSCATNLTPLDSSQTSLYGTESDLNRLDEETYWESPQSSVQSYQQKTSNLVLRAFDMIDTDYSHAGNHPKEGFDCSGLVQFLFKESLGLHLPRTTRQQRYVGESADRYELRSGDLVFFNTQNRPFSHVGLYIGNDRFVHAPSRGKKVRVDSMQKRYWKKRFDGARRVIPVPQSLLQDA